MNETPKKSNRLVLEVDRIRRILRKHALAIVGHSFFGSAAIYFAALFFHPEWSYAFVRNVGVAVTMWTSLGVAFNFSTTQARTAEPWFAGLNVIVLGVSVLLCLVAMAHHSDLLFHAILVHVVLSLYVFWHYLARKYYSRHSLVWESLYEEFFHEDLTIWCAYLCTGYLPFFLSGTSQTTVEAASDGITAVILFLEFIIFWVDTKKQRDLLSAQESGELLNDEPLPEKILERVLSSGELRVGCFYWPPVVDCIYERAEEGKSESCMAEGFYGKWLRKVAANNSLKVTCVQSEWHNTEKQLKTQQIDILLCAFVTDTRKNYADFSRPFHQCAMHGVAQVGTRMWDIDALRAPEVKIVIAKNEVGFEFARAALGFDPEAQDPKFTVVTTNRVEEVASIVLGGTTDYVAIADALSIHCLQQRHKDFLRVVFDQPALKMYDCAVMFLKGQPDLKKWIEKEFMRARADGDITLAEKQLIAELGPTRFFRKV